MAPLTLDSRVSAVPRMVLRREGEQGGFLFDPDTARVTILNSTACAVWGLIDGRRTVRDVVAALAETYDGMGPEAAGAVLAAVQSLADQGAVEVVPE